MIHPDVLEDVDGRGGPLRGMVRELGKREGFRLLDDAVAALLDDGVDRLTSSGDPEALTKLLESVFDSSVVQLLVDV